MEISRAEETQGTEKVETHFDTQTDIGGQLTIDVVPAKKFAKQQQFSANYIGPDGAALEGNFLVKRLSLGEQAQIGVNKARLAQSLQVDPNTDSTLQMFAYLQAALIEKPDWFKPAEMFDDDLIIQVYRRCLAFEASFRKPLSQ